jgi:hypothetical protein
MFDMLRTVSRNAPASHAVRQVLQRGPLSFSPSLLSPLLSSRSPSSSMLPTASQLSTRPIPVCSLPIYMTCCMTSHRWRRCCAASRRPASSCGSAKVGSTKREATSSPFPRTFLISVQRSHVYRSNWTFSLSDGLTVQTVRLTRTSVCGKTRCFDCCAS